MHSFSAISLIALGLAAFASAVPVAAPTPDGLVSTIQTRDSAVTTVAAVSTIVSGATYKVRPLAVELQYIVAGNATAEVLTPILEEVKKIVNEAIGAVEALTNDPLDTVIDAASINGLANIVAALLCTIFTALGAVLKSVSALEYDIVVPLLYDVGVLVGQLLQLILTLVNGLLSLLLPLIGSILNIVLNLNVRSIISLLGLRV